MKYRSYISMYRNFFFLIVCTEFNMQNPLSSQAATVQTSLYSLSQTGSKKFNYITTSASLLGVMCVLHAPSCTFSSTTCDQNPLSNRARKGNPISSAPMLLPCQTQCSATTLSSVYEQLYIYMYAFPESDRMVFNSKLTVLILGNLKYQTARRHLVFTVSFRFIC